MNFAFIFLEVYSHVGGARRRFLPVCTTHFMCAAVTPLKVHAHRGRSSRGCWSGQPKQKTGRSINQITIKTPNPKFRLYWCFIEFIDWRYCQSCWYFDPACELVALLTFSLVHLPSNPPPPPCVNKYRGTWGRGWVASGR